MKTKSPFLPTKDTFFQGEINFFVGEIQFYIGKVTFQMILVQSGIFVEYDPPYSVVPCRF